MNMAHMGIQRLFYFRLSAFLILCFVLGGTSQNIVEPKFPLYLISLVFIGWSLVKLDQSSRLWKLITPMLFFGAFIVMNLIYLIPLPPSIWANLPGREVVQSGYELMGMELPWLPLSLAPETSLFSMFDFLPPIALFLCVGVLASKQELYIAVRILIPFAILTMFLGFLQISNDSNLIHYYEFTNGNLPVGLFSNVNHQASFLLMVIPFSIGVAIKVQHGRNPFGPENRAMLLFGYTSALTLLMGVFLLGSIAGYVLALPVVLGALLLAIPRTKKKKYIVTGGIIFAVAGIGIDFLFFGNHLAELFDEFTDKGQTSRLVMFAKTIEISKTFFPFGTGPGSFSSVYKLFENFAENTIPHAHNDFLEMLQEFGALGALWVGSFLIWWGRTGLKIMRNRRRKMIFAKCAMIATFLIIMHSLVDYPLRTISISTFFVFCICLMVLPEGEIE